MLSLSLIALDALLLKYGVMSWLDSIQASGIMATFAALIEMVMNLIIGN
jgi:hypothetical protein